MTPPAQPDRPAPRRRTAGRPGRILLSALLLTACLAPARAHAVEGSDIERPAYVSMVLADESLGEGERARAARLYQEALDAFVAIRRDHPGYKSDAIGFRMKYCRDRIAEIMSGELPAAAEMPAAPEPVADAAVATNAVGNAAAPAPDAAQDDAEAMSMRARADEMIRRIREERAHAQADAPAPPGPAPEKHGKAAPPAHDTTALEQKIIALSAATNEAGRARVAAEERIHELTARAEAAEKELQALKQEPEKDAARAAKTDEEVMAARREADEARRTGESLRASLTALTHKCEELAREREELQAELAKAAPEKPAPAAASEKAGAELAGLRRQLTETAAERDRLRGELSALRAAAPAAAPATPAHPAVEGARTDEQLRLLESAIANRDRENFELKARIGRLQQDFATAGQSGTVDGRPGGQTTAEAVRAERERLMRLFADEREALQMSQKVLEQQVQSLLSDLSAARKAAQTKPER